MPTAARTTASAPTVRRGRATRADRRDTGGSSGGGGERDTSAGVAVPARTSAALPPGGAGDRILFGRTPRGLERLGGDGGGGGRGPSGAAPGGSWRGWARGGGGRGRPVAGGGHAAPLPPLCLDR